MNNNINLPLFIIAEDGSVRLLQHLWEIDSCGMEPIDVADGVYSAYDSEGQILKLVTINEENGEIERPTEDVIHIPFLGKIIGVSNNRAIKAIPQGVKDTNKLVKTLVRDLSYEGYETDGLSLNELIGIYQRKSRGQA